MATPGSTWDHPSPFTTNQLGEAYDVLAPDGSEIRLLVSTAGCSMAHGSLPPGQVSRAIVHRTVEEVWYVTEGRGQVWRKRCDHEDIVDVGPGSALTIPVGVHFQFRTVGPDRFCFVMCSMPPWPGHEEAVRVADFWPVNASAAGAT
jgi:mannose-6-phosphate isomerase-like protein (cupin superfamily)